MKDGRADAASFSLWSARTSNRVLDYLALTKPRLNALVVATSAAGYYLGTTGRLDFERMVQAVAGTALVAGGAAVLNQVYERDTDALMRRTRLRPLPDGRVSPADARVFGVVLAAAGLAMLAARSTLLAALLAAATLVVYLVVYTPMKRRSPVATLIGAVPGALPPLIGWTAANGRHWLGGLTLFSIVFLWQIPHFMAIAWLYRDDYGKAGFPMLPVIEPDGRKTGRQAVAYAAALLPVSLVPSLIGLSGSTYSRTRAGFGHPSADTIGPLCVVSQHRLCSGAVSWVNRVLAPALDRHDRGSAITFYFPLTFHFPLSTFYFDLRGSSCRQREPQRDRRRVADRRLFHDARAADRTAPAIHDRGVRNFVVVSGQLSRLPRAGWIGQVHPSRPCKAALLYDPHYTCHVGRGSLASRDSDPVSGAQRALPATPAHSPVDVSDLALCVGHGRPGLRLALSTDLAAVN